MMNKTITFLILFFLCLLTVSAQNNNKYIIKGTLPDGSNSGAYVYLSKTDPNSGLSMRMTPMDSIRIVDNYFEMKGIVNEKPSFYALNVADKTATLILEPGTLEVIFPQNNLMLPYIKGTVTNDLLYNKILAPTEKFKLSADSIVALKIEEKLTPEEEQDLFMSLQNESKALMNGYIEFIKPNIDNPAGESILLSIGSILPEDMLSDIIPQLTEETKEKFDSKRAEAAKRMSQMQGGDNAPEAVKVGKPYVDFISRNTEGNIVTFSEIAKGKKLILIDFWASWCAPCIEEMPKVVEMHEKYEKDGLMIVGISLDPNETAWKKAIERLNMNWIQLIDSENNIIRDTYGVQMIPYTILIDSSGIIRERNLRGVELEKAVDKLLKE
ncbi:MAG: TlpA disulfide reductase family protein [Dysgonomonas sp.]|nr:TlpA disulfide reductase family protein [Dysgonomonas sp.]